MAFVLEVERLGQAVEDGELSLADGAAALIGAQDGGLSGWAAVYELRHWRTAHLRYDNTEFAGVVDLQAEGAQAERWHATHGYRVSA